MRGMEGRGGSFFPFVELGIQGCFIFILLPQNSPTYSRSDQGIALHGDFYSMEKGQIPVDPL